MAKKSLKKGSFAGPLTSCFLRDFHVMESRSSVEYTVYEKCLKNSHKNRLFYFVNINGCQVALELYSLYKKGK